MPNLEPLRKGRALALRLLAALSFLAPLLTRLVMGQAFYQTGSGKVANFERTVSFFTDLGIPLPAANAFLVSRLEFWGGLLLVVGLATRFVASGLAATMLVALATADRADFVGALQGTGESGLTDVVPFVYLLFLLWLALFGPGALSLDAIAARRLERGTKVPAAA